MTSAQPLEVVGVVNSGYEVEHPELILPGRLAERLGIWPDPPVGAEFVAYSTTGGEITACRIPNALMIKFPGWPQERSPEAADAVVSEEETEVLISDNLSSRIGLVLVDIARGLWIFRGEEIDHPRESEPRQQW